MGDINDTTASSQEKTMSSSKNLPVWSENAGPNKEGTISTPRSFLALPGSPRQIEEQTRKVA